MSPRKIDDEALNPTVTTDAELAVVAQQAADAAIAAATAQTTADDAMTASGGQAAIDAEAAKVDAEAAATAAAADAADAQAAATSTAADVITAQAAATTATTKASEATTAATTAQTASDDAVAAVATASSLLYYDMAGGFPGPGVAGDVLLQNVIPRDMYIETGTYSANAGPHVGFAGTAADAQATFDVKRRTTGGTVTTVGTVEWAATGQIPTFTFAQDVQLLKGEVLTLVSPASPDVALADVSVCIVATLGTV